MPYKYFMITLCRSWIPKTFSAIVLVGRTGDVEVVIEVGSRRHLDRNIKKERRLQYN
jgi:hypothetical protein